MPGEPCIAGEGEVVDADASRQIAGDIRAGEEGVQGDGLCLIDGFAGGLSGESLDIMLEFPRVLQAVENGEQAPDRTEGDMELLLREDRGDGCDAADRQGQAQGHFLECLFHR